MGLKGATGASMSIESPKTKKQQRDAKKRQEAIKRAKERNYEFYTKYRCTVCLKESAEVVKGHTHNFCQYCYITGRGLNIAEEMSVKGKRLKPNALLPKKRMPMKKKKKKTKRKSKSSVNN